MKGRGLILALDVRNKERALEIAGATSEHLEAIKVGYPLVLSTGLEVIRGLKELGKPVIADFKVADVPHTSRAICSQARKAGADSVIVQGFVGEDVVEACSREVEVLVVAEMSHPGARSFIQPVSVRIAEMAREHARGIVAPATRPERVRKLREIVGPGMTIISPGVKAQGARVGEAMRAGADFEIVGRAIYESSNPGEEAGRIARALKKI